MVSAPNSDFEKVKNDSRQRAVGNISLYTAPYWLIIMVGLWLFVISRMAVDSDYTDAFNNIVEGIPMTLWIAVASYAIALVIGLLTGILRANPPQVPSGTETPGQLMRRVIHTITYHLVTVYVEFMRGIPALVFLLIAGFVVVPAIREPIQDLLNGSLVPFHNSVIVPLLNVGEMGDIVWRGRDPATAIAGLSLVYGAFLSEIFRAGIQAVPRGQMEAAKSLGMTNFQAMRHVIIPQAVRSVLPPLGNDFIAMIKDTSLVTILGTNDITQLARIWASSQFTFLQTYAVLTVIYLTLTVTGSLLVQVLERRLNEYNTR